MPQPVASAICCINPDCQHPYPHNWGNRFCNSCGSPLQLKNRYIPLQRLGSGGFATIYTVWDLEAQTQKVLKVLVQPSPKALELFEQEAAVLASLQHPGVPRVEPNGYFHVETQNWSASPRSVKPNASRQGNSQKRQLPCLVMEKINGQTLQEILEQHPQGCPEVWVLNWLTQAVEILQELHSRQIIHRDLKPSNLMLRQTGQVVVIDFGGAKQISSALIRSQTSSTRLFSSGYSPPEQLAGGAVGPAADFYALGRTMIQLLTGKDFSDLEDPMTGKLQWRNLALVSSALGDLLDALVHEDVRQRPANATAIQGRLTRISQKSVRQVSFFKPITQLTQTSLDWLRAAVSAFTKGISQTALFLLRAIVNLARACLDTIWEILLGTIGGCVGTSTGFVLAYWSPLGANVAGFLSQQLSRLLPDTQITLGAEILLFAGAGLGTAWGLTAAGGFGQQRRHLVAALMGLLGYGLGYLVWQAATLYTGTEGIVVFITVAVALLTLGLGLPSHHLVHSVVASSGCVMVFAGVATFYPYSDALVSVTASGSDLWVGIAFFSFLGVMLGFWLGVSYYLIVPFLRFLGWR